MAIREAFNWLEKEYCLLGASALPLMAGAVYAGHSNNDAVSKGIHTAIEIPYVYCVVEFMSKRFNLHPLVGIGTALAVKNLADYIVYGQERNLWIAAGATAGGLVSESLRRILKKRKSLEESV